MIRITVSLLPANMGEDIYTKLFRDLNAAVIRICEQDERKDRGNAVVPNEVLAQFPRDLMKEGLGEELIATIEFFDPNQFTHFRAKECAIAVHAVLTKFADALVPQCANCYVRVLPLSDSQYCLW